mgnify:CR=1 FL=1
MFTGIIQAIGEVRRINSNSARRLFRDMAKQHGIPMARKPRRASHALAYWNEMVGTPELLLGIIGPTADCIVLSHPKPRGSGPARAFLVAALMDSGKPLLVLAGVLPPPLAFLIGGAGS